MSPMSRPETSAPTGASSGVTVTAMRVSGDGSVRIVGMAHLPTQAAVPLSPRRHCPRKQATQYSQTRDQAPQCGRMPVVTGSSACADDDRFSESAGMTKPTIAFLSLILAICTSASSRAQDSVASFYKGKTVTIIAASSPGGGYDLYARLIARVLGRHIPGNPTVTVANMPGAASNVAAAHIYNLAPKDGTVIGALFM